MGILLDELKDKAQKLQNELNEINQQILKYEVDPILEKSDYEAKINFVKSDAIYEFMNLLDPDHDGLNNDPKESVDTNLEKIEQLLEKYMISHEYEEDEGLGNFRPAQSNTYKFLMKDFEVTVSITLQQGHDEVESDISIYFLRDDDNLCRSLFIFNKDLQSIYKSIAKKYKDKLSQEEIKDYSLIFHTLQQTDLEDFGRFC